MNTKDELIRLYANKSKHSNYQILASKLQRLLNGRDIETSTRFERERLRYLLDKMDVMDKGVLDIGANTGFFSFELLDAGAEHVDYYEGNPEHAEFMRLSAEALDLKSKVDINNKYYLFDGSDKNTYDIVLLFNVLHHLGDDYGNKELSMDAAKTQITEQLNSMADSTKELVYQMGFNWHGDVNKPLFEHGTKREMIDFVKQGIAGTWDIENIGVAARQEDHIIYEDLNNANVERDDSLGEFLNRPIFILKSKKV